MNARESTPVVPGFLAHFERTVQACEDSPALWSETNVVSYGSLSQRALVIQAKIAELGIDCDVPVAIHTQSRELAITAMIAILRHGCAYLPLDPLYPKDRLDYMVSHAQAALTITDNDQYRAPVGAHLDLRGIDFEQTIANCSTNAVIAPDTNAYVIYTSGSTGQPKGVLMNHGTLDNLIYWQNQHYTTSARFKTLQFSALSFDVSFQEIFSTLTQGGTLYLIDSELKQDFRRLLEYIDEQGVERIFLPYIALLQLIMWANRLKCYPSSLREVVTAGEQLVVSREIRTAFNALNRATLSNQYGPCETHVVSEYKLSWPADNWPALPPIGKAIEQAELLILNDSLEPVDQGDVGELFISGPVLAHGYINSPDQTLDRFITLPSAPDHRVYRTGDLVSRNADGDLLYHGRIDSQVKINGYRVELSEVEARLLDTGYVGEVAAAVHEVNGQKKLVAFITASSHSDKDPTILKQHLLNSVPEYMVPSRFYWVDQLKKTPSGKIDRKTMIEEIQKPTAEPSDRNGITEELVAIIKAELRLPDLSLEDNLQDKGMDSLDANRIAAAFFEHQKLSIPVYSLFQYRTLGQFLKYATERQSVPVEVSSNRTAKGDKKNDTAARDVAIIGMALRVPGANSLEEFWQNLIQGQESITFFTPTDPESGAVNARGVIDDPLGFDDRFFGVSPIEAEFVDPQQRLLLELAWHALENSGYDPEKFAGKIGVFCGVGNNTYYLNNVLKNQDKLEDYGALQAMVANEKDYAATRLAHKLNLVGPALSIHTACSTSLVAVAEAVEAIRNGRCDIAIAGGASLTFPQQQPHTHQEGSIYTRDGHTRPFDKNSSGTVFSDGGGLVVLKRLDEAQRDRDSIYAAIAGIAVNNDGAEKGSFSGPSVQGQKSVILSAIRDAKLEVRRIGYVEAHGTATPIGDPIEVSALNEAFAEYTPDKQFCRLGSVKSNIGHLTAAAGVVGLIKSVLSIDRGQIPPSINFDTPNAELKLEQSPFVVAQAISDWDTPKAERVAGVSSFGIGGTNAHVLLKGVDSRATSEQSNTPDWVPLCFSAHSANALSDLLSRYQPLLNQTSGHVARSELAAALIRHRRPFSYRLSIPQQIKVHELVALIQDAEDADPAFKNPTVALAFPGQGSQVASMGRSLYASVAGFRVAFDACAEILKDQHSTDIASLVFTSGDPLKETQKTQISLFCIGYSLASELSRLGIKPQVAIGHSIGELIAATIAGVFDLQTAIRVVMARGEAMQAQPTGAMLAVRSDAQQLAPLLPTNVVIAAENTVDSCTVSGSNSAIDAFSETLEQNGIKYRTLNTSHAFHSPSMDGASEHFFRCLAGVTLSEPRIPFISCVTGDWITSEQATDLTYWASQIRQPVQFRKGCETLGELKNLVLMECGPQGTVCGMVLQNLSNKSDLALVTLAADAGDLNKEVLSFADGLGKAWCSGVAVDWPCGTSSPELRAKLPGYPFQHRTHVIDPEFATQAAEAQPVLNPPASSDAAILPTQQNLTGPRMKDAIIEKLRTLFGDISGIDLSRADGNATFFELGLDSLLLTQSTLKLKKKFKINITFRQLLNDCGNLNALADYLIKEGISIEGSGPVPAATPVSNSQQPANSELTSQLPPRSSESNSYQAFPRATPGDIQSLLQQQMQILQGQLSLLSSLSGQPAATAASPVGPLEQVSGNSARSDRKSTTIKPFGAGTRINVKRSNDMTAIQRENFDSLAARYNRRFTGSKQFAQDNRKQLADPRVVSGFRNTIKDVIYPIVVERSEGPYLWDIDGGRLIDITCGFGSNFFGNSAAFIKEAIGRQLDTGYEIGPQHPLVADASRLFCQVTGNERVAFCNTGSEAVLGAMRLARTVTAKEKVVIFENDYHGIHDDVIVTRGSKGYAVPAAAGIPDAAVENMIVLDYGSEESLDYISEHADEIAAILVEPVQSRHPDLQPRDFLQKARGLCTDRHIALIFDEVITGFRIHPRGAQGFYGIDADICTYGKIVGGGLPIGAISGKSRFMDALDGGQWQFGDDSAPEVGVTYFAGTFVRHPLVLSAAVAVLQRMADEPNLQSDLNQRADHLVSEINQHAQLVGAPLKVENCGSMCKVKIPQDIAFEELIYVILREKGIHAWDARPMFITTAHSDEDINAIIKAFKEAMDEMIALEFFPAPASALPDGNGAAQKPPVEGARLGRDESGKATWYVPSVKDKNQYEKWAG
ncbi:polyketide synthase [Marinobacter apostichopi]|uniref:polyketide synthase n=1 Tax=Marinobacter apostichopi TaxID=3035454 RepID=UPI002573E17C|nr:polyketide synthase [Marinobacter sp. LA51]